jgi:hypothetical protein
MPAFRRVKRVVLHLLLAWGLSSAAAANAAMVVTDRPCYLEQKRVELTGAGFQPGSTYNVLRDGQQIGTGTVAPDGSVAGAFGSDVLPAGIAEKSYDLSVSDGVTQATSTFRVSAFRAMFSPSRGNATRLRVRFSVFGLLADKLPVYLHYVRPDGTEARTLYLGRTKGSCGSIAQTRMRKLFPFSARAGRWLLQFDTQKAYRTGAQPRIVRAVTVKKR